MDALILRVGSVDKSSALKALATWVDLGVIKEDTEHSFRLLERAEAMAPGSKPPAAIEGKNLPQSCPRLSLLTTSAPVDERPPISSMQQQQAEQMKIYWKVIELSPSVSHSTD